MRKLSLEEIYRVVVYYTSRIWGAKAVMTADWKAANIAQWIYSYCEIYKVDPVLALAQGVVECHFGVNPLAGRSRRTKNIYNVGNVDSGADELQPTWQAGIERYCRLMQKEYNWGEDANGAVSLESMVKHDFTRPRGGRYATAADYTKQVAAIGKKIRTMVGE